MSKEALKVSPESTESRPVYQKVKKALARNGSLEIAGELEFERANYIYVAPKTSLTDTDLLNGYIDALATGFDDVDSIGHAHASETTLRLGGD